MTATGGEGGGAARLAVTRLRLGRYRSYRAGEIAPGTGSVALFGANGAGKTNLLEAVSLLVPGRGLRRAAPDAVAQAPEPAGWRLSAEIAGLAGPAGIVTGAGPGETGRRVDIDGKTAPQTRLGDHLRMVWLTPAMDGLWTDTAGARRRFLDRLTMGFAPEHAQGSIDYEKAMRERNRLLRAGGADPAWLAALEARMGRLGAAIARARAEALARLSAAQGAGAGDFPEAELSIEGAAEARFARAAAAGEDVAALESVEADRLAAALARGREADAAAGRALSGPHRSDLVAVYAEKGMAAALCSTGEQKALLISLALANARALAGATGAAPVLILDEVAAHLDADRRAALNAALGRIGAQVWASGTAAVQLEGLPGARLVEVVEHGGVSALREA